MNSTYRPVRSEYTFVLILWLLLGLGFVSCGGPSPKVAQHTPSNEPITPIRLRYSNYYNFISTLKNNGFEFWDFEQFQSSDKAHLPANLIVIRHDIHYADIPNGYLAHEVEMELLGLKSATYFVQLNDPKEEGAESRHNAYLLFVEKLANHGVDIQPHISPIDMYIANYNPKWNDLTKDQLAAIFISNYTIKIYPDGTDILVTGDDSFDLNKINLNLPALLNMYNKKWISETGLNVRYYAAHGTSTPMNAYLNNALLLDQRCLLKLKIYEFDTYNTSLGHELKYLSDNYLPSWMSDPGSIKPGRYQLLIHPHLW